MSVRSTLSQTNSHISMLMDMVVDETPDINSDDKNFLHLYPTEVFLVIEKKNCVFVSVYLRDTDTTFVCVSSSVLSLFYRENVDYATLFTKAVQTAVSTEHAPHFFDEPHIGCLSPQREAPPLHPDPRHQHGRWCGVLLLLMLHPAVRRRSF